jgi:hypothetical protein
MTTDLKPCPFCGGPAMLEHKLESWGYTPDRYKVICANCKGSTGWYEGRIEGTAKWPSYCQKQAKNDAIMMWNQRSYECQK